MSRSRWWSSLQNGLVVLRLRPTRHVVAVRQVLCPAECKSSRMYRSLLAANMVIQILTNAIIPTLLNSVQPCLSMVAHKCILSHNSHIPPKVVLLCIMPIRHDKAVTLVLDLINQDLMGSRHLSLSLMVNPLSPWVVACRVSL